MSSTAALEDTGLNVLTVSHSGDLAAALARAGDDGVNLVRLAVPAPHAVPASGDWFTRPRWIAWFAEVPEGLTGLLAQQGKGERQRTRAAVRQLERADVSVQDVIGPEAFEEWLVLYRRCVQAMPAGTDVVGGREAEILDPANRHGLLTVRSGGDLVAGCVFRVDEPKGVLHTRFAAVRADARDHDLYRGMYARLADEARRLGVASLSLGRDVNLYGALLRPGLCAFKLRLGFRPLPAQVLTPERGGDVTEQVVGLHDLAQPVVFFAYPDPAATGGALRLVVVTTEDFDGPLLRYFPAHVAVKVAQ